MERPGQRDDETPVTVYANTVRVQTSGDDLVLEFGRFVPDAEHPVPPLQHLPEVKVVIARALIAPLMDVLRQHAPAIGVRESRSN
jgi:hypothetical protein